MLILEGPDMVGKTTMAQQIAAIAKARLGVDVAIHHHTQEHRHLTLRDYVNLVMECGKRPVIFDRFHLSEPVYGAVCRGTLDSGLALREAVKVTRAIEGAGGLVVLVSAHPTAYTLQSDQCHGRGELFDAERCAKVNCAFNMLNGHYHLSEVEHTVRWEGGDADAWMPKMRAWGLKARLLSSVGVVLDHHDDKVAHAAPVDVEAIAARWIASLDRSINKAGVEWRH
jgi:hypothetical protein